MQCLDFILLILCGSALSALEKHGFGSGSRSETFLYNSLIFFLQKKNFIILFSSWFAAIFMLKPDEQKKDNFFYNLFFRNQKNFFLPFFVDIFSLGSASVDPHIFADWRSDPGRQNVADPLDPDPKHCLNVYPMYLNLTWFRIWILVSSSGSLSASRISCWLGPYSSILYIDFLE